MYSMTGCGQGSAENENYKITINIKGVNNRYLDVSTRLPRAFAMLEDKIRKSVSRRLNRGKLEIYVTVDEIGGKNSKVIIDKELAVAYYNAMRELSALLSLQQNSTVAEIISYPGVITVEEEETNLDNVWELLKFALDEALDNLVAMREIEGAALASDILSHLEITESLAARIAERSPLVVSEYREKLRTRIEEALGEVEIDEARLVNEVAFFTDKADINEELTRLNSHFKQFRVNMEKSEPVGRKLDFLVQEINREINTIGSKANDCEITSIVVDAKSEMEKVREQIQNIE